MQQCLLFSTKTRVGALLSVLLWGASATAAGAEAPHEPTHVVRQGETLGEIALSHHVSLAALRLANRLKEDKAIRVGQTLKVPAPDRDDAAERGRSIGAAVGREPANGVRPDRTASTHPRMKAGVVRLVRGSETLQTRLLDRRRHLVANKLPEVARLLRFGSGAQHDIDPRLVTLVGMVSDHFGGRDILVVSGFRPYTPRQFTAHSNHNIGRALDFTIPGVSNEALRDFCRTLHNVGVGYYPNSSFVHLDVRNTSTFWIDYAGPGQSPRYHRAESKLDADEGAGEVQDVPSVDDPAGTKADPGPKACDPPGSSSARDQGSVKRDSTGSESVFPSR
jgi:uncharacterized protein YcbK (DUF882 family)